MAFWRFGLANESAIDTLLKDWQAPSSRQSAIDSVSPSASSKDAAEVVSPTLEQLLEEDDLLQETKSGHTKLLEYLSSPQAIRRMLAYISGEAFEEDKPLAETEKKADDEDEQKEEADEVPPPVPAKDVKPPSFAAHNNKMPTPTPKATTFAEQVAAMPKQTPEEQELARKRLKYPYLCMEILSLDPPQVTDEIFRDTDTYIVPFWNYILDKGTNTSPEQALQVGHWAKVNIQWLSGSRVTQMIKFLRALPSLFDRMLVHLPSLSPISDILTKLVNMDDSHPQLGIIAWLHQQQLVPKALELLDPVSQPIDAHTPAGEFLRGIVAAASTASANKQQQQQQQQAAPTNGNDAWTTWPDNTLVRELASETTIKRLLHYMLDARPIEQQQLPDTKLESTDIDLDSEDVPPTPTASTHTQDPTILPSQSEVPSSEDSPEAVTPKHISPPPKAVVSAEAATSSLLNSLSLIIDIIRKNNSDFTELQILQYLERTHDEDDDEDELRGGEGEGEETHHAPGQGPSLVDLSPLLTNLTQRLPDLHQLLLNPRSSSAPIKTTLQSSTSTVQEPLTQERFRICELYAELLHCSNMAILNRPSGSLSNSQKDIPAPSYDATTGRILGTRREAYEQLSKALNSHPLPEEENDSSVVGNVGSQAGSGHGHGEESLADPNMLHDELYIDGRPVTAVSDATSSYTSGASDGGPEQEDSEDVLEFLHSTIEDLSLEDDAQALSAQSSPRPPSYPNSPNPNHPLPSSSLANPSSPVINQASPKVTSNGRADRPPPLDSFKLQSSKLPTIVEKPLLPGEALKSAFVKLNVPLAVLDLFFRFPWNNFLHNVVYDLVQQIFNGKLDPGPSRDLCLSIFCEGEGLVNRVLGTIEENKRITSISPGIRLGHMGHVTLISEEIVKLFYNSPKDILAHIPASMFSRDRWETYVDGLLRETRERDLQPLGGGISIAMHASVSAGSAGNPGIGISEMDDEFPGPGKNFFATDDGEGSPNSSPDKAHFARYLAAQISSDYPGQSGHNALNASTSSSSSSGSSSSDDIPDHRSASSQARGLHNAASNWFSGDREGDSAFDDDDDEEDDVPGVYSKSHQDYDLGIGASTAGPKPHVARQEKFGFDDAFDPSKFGTGDSDDDEDEDGRRLNDEDEDDDGFDPFADSYAARPSPQAVSGNKNAFSFDDDFGSTSLSALAKARLGTVQQQKLTPADWNASFRSSYDATGSSSTGVNFKPSFGEFGEFSSAQDDQSPNGDFDDDDDFGDFAEAGDVDVSQGDYDFSQTGSAPVLPKSPQRPAAPPARQSFSNPISPPRKQATSLPGTPGEEVTGPGVHEGAHISKDGMHVEAEIEVNGETVTVQVPKDELTLHPETLKE